MAVTVPSARLRYRSRVRRVSLLGALLALVLRLPFAVQFVLAIVAAVALGGLIGTILGGADAVRDLGGIR